MDRHSFVFLTLTVLWCFLGYRRCTTIRTAIGENSGNGSFNVHLDIWEQPYTSAPLDDEEPLNAPADDNGDRRYRIADDIPLPESPPVSVPEAPEEDEGNQLPSPEEDTTPMPMEDSIDICSEGCTTAQETLAETTTGTDVTKTKTTISNTSDITKTSTSTQPSESTVSVTEFQASTQQTSTTTLSHVIENHIPVENPINKDNVQIHYVNIPPPETKDIKKKEQDVNDKTTSSEIRTNVIMTSRSSNRSTDTFEKTTSYSYNELNYSSPEYQFSVGNMSHSDDYKNESSTISSKDIKAFDKTSTDVESPTTTSVQNPFVTTSTESLPETSLSFSPILYTLSSTNGTSQKVQSEEFGDSSTMSSPTVPILSSEDSTESKEEIKTAPTLRPRLTNPNCNVLPICVKVHVISEPLMCNINHESVISKAFKTLVKGILDKYTKPDVHHWQIVLEVEPCSEPLPTTSVVSFYITDSMGEYEEKLTAIAGVLLKKMGKSSISEKYQMQVTSVETLENESNNLLSSREVLAATPPPLVAPHSGMIAAVAISVVAGTSLCLLCILLLVMKQRLAAQQMTRQQQPPQGMDTYSLDSFSINASFRRRGPGGLRNSAFLNHAFARDGDDTIPPSRPMSTSALAAALSSRRRMIEQEFERLPMNMCKLDEVPVGAETKNRYANVVPNSKTRVIINDKSEDQVNSYINANFVKGYDGRPKYYIACQAPLNEYIEDFWRMVWEQQSRVILMLTQLQENGISRCAPYFPESTLDCRQLHENYAVSLVKKDVREFYTASTFKLVDIEKNQSREVLHLWYKAWPAVGLPTDPSSLVSYLLQARSLINNNTGPTVVHCSAGTGRTGVVIALDICMREYEALGCVDVIRSVSRIRADRGGAVQNKDQYLLIHEALLEYASSTANQSQRASLCSSN